jgi:hypothetical protein
LTLKKLGSLAILYPSWQKPKGMGESSEWRYDVVWLRELFERYCLLKRLCIKK